MRSRTAIRERMRLLARLIVVIALGLAALTSQGAAREQWYDYYEDALQAIERGHPRKAIDLLGTALARKPQAGRLRTHGNTYIRYAPQFWLGVAYHDLDDCERAIASFDRSEADDETVGTPVLAARLRTLRRACELRLGPTAGRGTAVPKLGPKVEAPLDPRRLERGLRAYLAGDLASAVRAFDDLAREAPDSAMPHLLLGMALHGQWSVTGEADATLLERVRDELSRAARIDPQVTPHPALCSPELVALYQSLR